MTVIAAILSLILLPSTSGATMEDVNGIFDFIRQDSDNVANNLGPALQELRDLFHTMPTTEDGLWHHLNKIIHFQPYLSVHDKRIFQNIIDQLISEVVRRIIQLSYMPLSVEHEKEEEPVHIASFLETKYSQYVAPSMRSVKNSIDSFDWSNLIGKTKNYFGLLRNNEKKDEH
ncbi:uncharacterized protein LOC118433564 [Folsomia candida]|uniref:uncharacterized protein LOC118433564 n=1 Tax=Folsomia candida TaxID=158441 RepID=UPI001604EF51|nr:uncharacterized protein LOC118433564 [Folsomia candida]